VLTFGSNAFAIGGVGLVVAPGPGLTAAELRTRAAYLARAAIGEARRIAVTFVLSLVRRAAAELSKLARWRVAEVEAIAATPAPVPAGRGPPVRGTAVTPANRAPGARSQINASLYSIGAPPSMTPKCKRAPGRFLARGSLKIFPEDPTALAVLIAMVPLVRVIMRAVGILATDTARPTPPGGRYDLAI
jgi:hypothetical protein